MALSTTGPASTGPPPNATHVGFRSGSIDIGLNGRAGARGERLVGVAVDLTFAREYECPGEAGLSVGTALVDVNGDYAD